MEEAVYHLLSVYAVGEAQEFNVCNSSLKPFYCKMCYMAVSHDSYSVMKLVKPPSTLTMRKWSRGQQNVADFTPAHIGRRCVDRLQMQEQVEIRRPAPKVEQLIAVFLPGSNDKDICQELVE